MSSLSRRNLWSFSVGTLGRDFIYTMVTMFLIVFLTEVLDLDDQTMWWVSGIILAARVFDAFTDILMGGVVDNSRTRWGAYKPWIALGVLVSAACAVTLFTDTGLRGPAFVAFFAVTYLLWGLAWTTNDIPYWSLLPALTLVPTERERLASATKIFATIGLFAAVVSVTPVTRALGGGPTAWTTFVAAGAVAMVAFQAVTVIGVREPSLTRPQERTGIRELFAIVIRNDQLVAVAFTMILFITAYTTTTTFGIYFFKYAYRDETMYSPFAAVLGVAQLLGYAVFPTLSRWLGRRRLFGAGIAMSMAGYVVFFLSPMNMVIIGAAGLLLFTANSIIVVLMLVAVSDCIEYGQWRSGRRNGAVTFSLQPFIYKVAGALGSGVVAVTLILTGINSAADADDVTPAGLLGMKVAMMGLPAALIAAAFLVYRRWYRIDNELHARIVAELRSRGQLGRDAEPG